jgi:hypothetical protein
MVIVKMVKIENNQESFVQLWRRLERTRHPPQNPPDITKYIK